jgi:hypothetical protein
VNRLPALFAIAAALAVASHAGAVVIGDTVAAADGPIEVLAGIGSAGGNTRAAGNALVDYANVEFTIFDYLAGPASGTVTRLTLSSGFATQADIGYHAASGAVFGLRIASVFSLAGADLDATTTAGDHLVESWGMSVTNLPILVGFWLNHDLSNDVALRGSLFAGPAIGHAVLTDDWELTGPSFGASKGSSIVAYQGTTFAADLGGEIDWRWTRRLTLVIGLGYRYCRFVSMRAAGNADIDGDGYADVLKGDAFQDGRGRAVPFDFSGLTTTFGLRWRFDR